MLHASALLVDLTSAIVAEVDTKRLVGSPFAIIMSKENFKKLTPNKCIMVSVSP